MDTLVGALISSFSPTEVVTAEGRAACGAALNVLSNLARGGYLKGAKPTTAQFMAQLTSSFVVLNTNTSSSANSTVYPVETAVASLAQGVALTMVNGQDPIYLTTPNVRLTVLNQLATDLINTTISPPLTAAAAAYGSLQAGISLRAAGISPCSYQEGYARMSVMEWATNPYAGSLAVAGPLLRFSSDSKSSRKSRRLQQRSLATRYTTPDLSGTPAYFVTLEFSTRQYFNYTLARHKGITHSNKTVPECTVHRDNEYIPCNACNVSSYTDYNVTFSCYNPSILCPPSTSTTTSSRRALRGEGRSLGTYHSREDDEEDDMESTARRLGANDDGGASAESDVTTYGPLLKSLAGEAKAVFSLNPFAINLQRAKVILIFTSCLLSTIVFGLCFFRRWDYNDYQNTLYAKGKTKSKMQVQIEAAMLRRSISGAGAGDGDDSIADLFRDKEEASSKAALASVPESQESIAASSEVEPTAAAFDFLGLRRRSSLSSLSQILFGDWGSSKANVLAEDLEKGSKNDKSDEIHDEVDFFDVRRVTSNGAVEDNGGKVEPDDEAVDEDGKGDDNNHDHPPRRVKSKIKKGNKNNKNHVKRKPSLVKPERKKVMIHDFFDTVFSWEKLLDQKRGRVSHIVTFLREDHQYLSMFGRASQTVTRLDRFMTLVRAVLIGLFIDTLFFYVFYPTNGTCEVYTTEESCRSVPSGISTSTTQCKWDDANLSCTVLPPPASAAFILIVALLCTIIAGLPSALLGYAQSAYASRRPRVSELADFPIPPSWGKSS
jgi:hypothetical protein